MPGRRFLSNLRQRLGRGGIGRVLNVPRRVAGASTYYLPKLRQIAS